MGGAVLSMRQSLGYPRVCRSRGEKRDVLAEATQAQARVSTQVAEDLSALPPVLLMDED